MAYNDMYNDYSCCNIPYDYPYSFEERNKIYLQCKQIPYWIWNEFDTVSITFDITKLLKNCPCYPEITFEDIDANIHRFYLDFYNFRYEHLFQVEKEITETVTFDVTKDISEEYFPSGIYYCSLILKSIETEEDTTTTSDSESTEEDSSDTTTTETSETIRTILNKEDCLLYVK